MTINKKILGLSIAFLLSGCSMSMIETQKKADEAVVQNTKEIEQSKSYFGFSKIDKPYLGARLNIVKKEPDFLKKQIDFGTSPVDLDALSGKLSLVLGMPVRMSMDIPFTHSELPSLSTNEDLTSLLPNAPVGLQPALGITALTRPAPLTSPIRFKGAVKDLLNLIASQTRTQWKYNEHSGLVFSRYTTEVFRLDALAGEFDLNDSVSANGSSGSSSGGSDGKTSGTSGTTEISSGFKVTSTMWEDVKKTLTSMQSDKGKFSINATTGAITVTDTFEVIDQVRSYIEKENEVLSQQVLFEVKVFLVTNNDSDGFNLNLAMNSNGLTESGKLTNGGVAVDGAGTLGFGLIRDNGHLTMDGVISALSKNVSLSKVTQASVITQNCQPAPLQVADEITYLAKVSSTMATTGLSQASLEPGKITSGFSMNFLPRITTNKDILMKVGIDLSSLTSLKKDSASVDASGNPSGNSITTPEVARRNTLQRVIMGSGDILILSGFEKLDESSTKTGVGDNSFFGLGGGRSANRDKSSLLIVAKPVIINSRSRAF